MNEWYSESDLQKQGYALLVLVPRDEHNLVLCTQPFKDKYESILTCRTFDTFDKELEKAFPRVHIWSRDLKEDSLAIFGQPRDPVAQWGIVYAAQMEEARTESMGQIDSDPADVDYDPPDYEDYAVMRPESYWERERWHMEEEKEEQARVWDGTWRRDYENQQGGVNSKPQVPTKKLPGQQGLESFL